MAGALDGTKVLDLSRVLVALGQPVAADLGATVIRKNLGAGDDTRHWPLPTVRWHRRVFSGGQPGKQSNHRGHQRKPGQGGRLCSNWPPKPMCC